LKAPGLSVGVASLDDLLTWGLTNSLWVFPMATSCCGIELMAAAASRVDIDRMGTIVRGTPRQADVMVRGRNDHGEDGSAREEALGSDARAEVVHRHGLVRDLGRFLPRSVLGRTGRGHVHAGRRVRARMSARPAGVDARTAAVEGKGAAGAQRRADAADPNPALLSITKPSVPRLCDKERTPEMDLAQEESAATTTVADARGPVQFALPANDLSETPPDFAALLNEIGVVEPPRAGPAIVARANHLEVARRLKALGYRQLVRSSPATGRRASRARATTRRNPNTSRWLICCARSARGRVSRRGACAFCRGNDRFAVRDLRRSRLAGTRQYDLVGVPFAGHPDLRRLMMQENYPSHPLRRDFAINTAFAPWR
jgi:hypothetical protein